jgi:hypothetical protein
MDDDGGETSELMRIPPSVWPAFERHLRDETRVVVAWLRAVSETYPGRNLLEVLQTEPRLFPPFLRRPESTPAMQVCPATTASRKELNLSASCIC